MCIGNKDTSYIVFTVETKSSNTYKFALPLDNFPTLLPTITLAGEIRIAKHGAVLQNKGDKKKLVLTLSLKGKAHEACRYGIALFLDKVGLLKHPQTQVEDSTLSPLEVTN